MAITRDGETARIVMARYLRKVLGAKYDVDLSRYSDSEILDTIGYHVFPNVVLFPGLSLPMVYRFRPGFDAAFGAVYDQDTNNLRAQQQGFRAAKKPGQTLGNYQEVRIRHFQRTLDKYLADERQQRVADVR
jgi:hypothetical protein